MEPSFGSHGTRIHGVLIGLVGLGTIGCSSGTAAPQTSARTESTVALRPQQAPKKPPPDLPPVETKVTQDSPPDLAAPPPESASETPTDPRSVPPDTPPEHARAFHRLPVSVHDGPPVGGIGKTGIHIDRVWLGNEYGRRGCSGITDNFPTAKQQVNVCFRVVHPREAEQVNVIWEKETGDMVKRRRGVQIPAQHAYRSRAYLALRQEYIGRWTVRIFSEDEVELASTTFTVGPAQAP